MKFSVDDVTVDTKKAVRTLDIGTAINIYERARGRLLQLDILNCIELIQCRFEDKAKHGPRTMHFKCVVADSYLTTKSRHSIDVSMRVDWQEGGIASGTSLLVNKIVEELNAIAEELRGIAKLLEIKG